MRNYLIGVITATARTTMAFICSFDQQCVNIIMKNNVSTWPVNVFDYIGANLGPNNTKSSKYKDMAKD